MDVDLDATLRDLAPRLLRYCAGALRDTSLGEEIAQECLAALVKAWQAGRPPDNPDAFVFAIGRRRVRRALVRRRLLVPVHALFDRRDRAPNPEQQLLQEERRTRVAAAISQLSPSEREALLLVVAGENTIADAASVLGISTSALKMRLFRARHDLAARLNGHHER